MPKVARYIKDDLKARTVAIIYVNNDFGKGGRDVMMKALADRQMLRRIAGVVDPV
jgi:branched-chain amino acid transport system substrate-binding protein